MAWQVLITESALADLREIVEFIAQDDPQAAERMGHRLVARALALAAMPERHTQVMTQTVEFGSFRSYRIWFSITATRFRGPSISSTSGTEHANGHASSERSRCEHALPIFIANRRPDVYLFTCAKAPLFSSVLSGAVRDAILTALRVRAEGESVARITEEVTRLLGPTPASSIRSYLRLNTPQVFPPHGSWGITRSRTVSRIRAKNKPMATLTFVSSRVNGNAREQAFVTVRIGRAMLIQADCFAWLESRVPESVHAVVTDPPYGLVEYSDHEQAKLRAG